MCTRLHSVYGKDEQRKANQRHARNFKLPRLFSDRIISGPGKGMSPLRRLQALLRALAPHRQAPGKGRRQEEGESSLCALSGEKAGRHTAMYSAPSSPGDPYLTHSPALTSTPSPA